eukprot:sb/3463233/
MVTMVTMVTIVTIRVTIMVTMKQQSQPRKKLVPFPPSSCTDLKQCESTMEVNPPKLAVYNFGTTVTLTCEARGYPLPKVTFNHDNVELGKWESSCRRRPGNNTCELVLSKYSDNGRYECVASNDIRRKKYSCNASNKVSITFAGKPNVTLKVSERGGETLAHCVVEGNPAPSKIFWHDSTKKMRYESGAYDFVDTTKESVFRVLSTINISKQGKGSPIIWPYQCCYQDMNRYPQSACFDVVQEEKVVFVLETVTESWLSQSFKAIIMKLWESVGLVVNLVLKLGQRKRTVITKVMTVVSFVWRLRQPSRRSMKTPFELPCTATMTIFPPLSGTIITGVKQCESTMEVNPPKLAVYNFGTTVTLTCEARGYPLPKVTFNHDNVELGKWESSCRRRPGNNTCELVLSKYSDNGRHDSTKKMRYESGAYDFVDTTKESVFRVLSTINISKQGKGSPIIWPYQCCYQDMNRYPQSACFDVVQEEKVVFVLETVTESWLITNYNRGPFFWFLNKCRFVVPIIVFYSVATLGNMVRFRRRGTYKPWEERQDNLNLGLLIGGILLFIIMAIVIYIIVRRRKKANRNAEYQLTQNGEAVSLLSA